MGNFRIEIEAVGGHGCQREVKTGEVVQAFCGQEHCPDCKARAFVVELKKHNSVSQALLIHWPSQGTVVDNLSDLKRSGNF